MFFAILLCLHSNNLDKPYVNRAMTISTFSPLNDNKTEITKVLETIYNERCSMFINGDLTNLPSYYDTSQKLGEWSLKHEVKRFNYFNDWSSQRGIQLTKALSIPKIRNIKETSRGLRLLVDEYYKFEYIYKNDISPITNTFGVGLIHSMRVIKAEELILNTRKSLTEIALECGFNSIRTFNRVYKKIKGYVPSSVR